MPTISYNRGPDHPGPRVFLAIPTGSGEITAPCVAALMGAIPALNAAGFAADYCIEAGNCHVDDARNSLVREFLKTDCDDLVFIDADVGFQPADLVRLVSVDRDIVGGVYPKKQEPEDFPVFVEPGTELWAEADGLVEVHGLPTGFLRIRRRVLEALRDKAASFIGQAGDSAPYHVIFERLIEGGRRWSGDYAFCRKARAAGFRLHADPEMAFTHTGPKTWGGAMSLGEFWKRRHGVHQAEQERRFGEAMARLKAQVPERIDFVTLSECWGNEWAASPALLYAIWLRARGRVLECGSGLSTLVLAAKAGVTPYALEHDPAFASHTRAMLERYGLQADLHCRPLGGGWYDANPGAFDMIVVDGPPRTLADRRIALQRCSAPVWIWDDYDGCELPGEVRVIDAPKPFAIAVAAEAQTLEPAA